jgi:hypothetical protein
MKEYAFTVNANDPATPELTAKTAKRMKSRFSNFVSSVHPDPDNIMMKQVYEVWDVIEKLADGYHSSLGVTHCRICGDKFNDEDEFIKQSRPKEVCTACFTSQA